MARREWWNDPEVEAVDIKRSDSKGIRVSVHAGNDRQDPILQVATVWNPAKKEGGPPSWVPLKSQPVIYLEDIIAEPKALDLLRRFVEAAEMAVGEAGNPPESGS